MFVDMETERGNTGPETEVGVVWTGIKTSREVQKRYGIGTLGVCDNEQLTKLAFCDVTCYYSLPLEPYGEREPLQDILVALLP